MSRQEEHGGSGAEILNMSNVFGDMGAEMTKQFTERLIRIGRELYNPMARPENTLGQDMSEADFLRLRPWLIPGAQGFTTEMENQYISRWDQDPTRPELQQALNDMANKKRWYRKEKISPLWKVCFYTMRCWPSSIITLEHHLAYEPEPGTRGSDQSKLWSAKFCHEMISLILSDIGRRHAPSMRMYLQYAVICRTNDTSLWPLVNAEDSHFLSRMIEAMRTDSDPRTPIPVIHKRIADALYAPGSERVRPVSSLVFEQIERQLYRPGTVPVQQHDRVCYKIRCTDLRCVIQAFDDIKLGYRTSAVDTDTFNNWFMRSRFLVNKPPSDENLAYMLMSSIQHEIRLEILYASQSGADRQSAHMPSASTVPPVGGPPPAPDSSSQYNRPTLQLSSRGNQNEGPQQVELIAPAYPSKISMARCMEHTDAEEVGKELAPHITRKSSKVTYSTTEAAYFERGQLALPPLSYSARLHPAEMMPAAYD